MRVGHAVVAVVDPCAAHSTRDLAPDSDLGPVPDGGGETVPGSRCRTGEQRRRIRAEVVRQCPGERQRQSDLLRMNGFHMAQIDDGVHRVVVDSCSAGDVTQTVAEFTCGEAEVAEADHDLSRPVLLEQRDCAEPVIGRRDRDDGDEGWDVRGEEAELVGQRVFDAVVQVLERPAGAASERGCGAQQVWVDPSGATSLRHPHRCSDQCGHELPTTFRLYGIEELDDDPRSGITVIAEMAE